MDVIQITTINETLENKILSYTEMEKAHILTALKKANWKISGYNSAAEILKLNPKTLESKMRKLGIRRMDFMTP